MILCTVCITLHIVACFSNYCFAIDRFNDVYINEYIDDVLKELHNNNIPAAIDILDNALSQYPNSIKLLKARSELLIAQLKLTNALSDIETLLKLNPYDTKSLLSQCLIYEYMGKSKEYLLQCYIDVVHKVKLNHSPDILKDDMDYVFAVILAELPDAEEVKRDFLKDYDDHFSIMLRKHINDFSRSKLIEAYRLLKEYNEKGNSFKIDN
jgi:tetratricopeptide (TPR) repeat protein